MIKETRRAGVSPTKKPPQMVPLRGSTSPSRLPIKQTTHGGHTCRRKVAHVNMVAGRGSVGSWIIGLKIWKSSI
jgi:hypothetical protein